MLYCTVSLVHVALHSWCLHAGSPSPISQCPAADNVPAGVKVNKQVPAPPRPGVLPAKQVWPRQSLDTGSLGLTSAAALGLLGSEVT